METRICSTCKKEFPLDLEHFYSDVRYRGGFKGQCRNCAYTPEYGRRKQLERRYKMTPAEYDALLESQGGHCALCPAGQFTHTRRLVIDHDHGCCPKEVACGKCTRGILCANCNRKVGFLEETLRESSVTPQAGTWTSRAMQYLEHWRDVHMAKFAEGIPHNYMADFFGLSLALSEADAKFHNNMTMVNIAIPKEV